LEVFIQIKEEEFLNCFKIDQSRFLSTILLQDEFWLTPISFIAKFENHWDRSFGLTTFSTYPTNHGTFPCTPTSSSFSFNFVFSFEII
jgi:hypothetical protein